MIFPARHLHLGHGGFLACSISLCEKRIELGVDPFDDDLVQVEIQLLAGTLQVDQPGMCRDKTHGISAEVPTQSV